MQNKLIRSLSFASSQSKEARPGRFPRMEPYWPQTHWLALVSDGREIRPRMLLCWELLVLAERGCLDVHNDAISSCETLKSSACSIIIRIENRYDIQLEWICNASFHVSTIQEIVTIPRELTPSKRLIRPYRKNQRSLCC